MSSGIPLESGGLLPDFYLLFFEIYIFEKSAGIPLEF
jgi:hypothetical protein